MVQPHRRKHPVESLRDVECLLGRIQVRGDADDSLHTTGARPFAGHEDHADGGEHHAGELRGARPLPQGQADEERDHGAGRALRHRR